MRENRVQELMTRFPRLNLAPTTLQWLVVAVFGLLLFLAVGIVLATGWSGTEGSGHVATGLKPSVSNDDLKVTYTPADAAAAKPRQVSITPPPLEGSLRIVSWDLSTLPAMEGGRANTESQASWRTSFGSERSTQPESLSGGTRYDVKADVLLLQGISDATLLRRYFFPARNWHLMVARQKLTTVAMQADPASAAVGITGVAIRVREGLRITGREYFPRIGGEVGEPGANLLAGTAVRVLDRGRTFWLASFAVPPACAETPAQCPARARLSEWQESKRQRGEAIVLGGMLASSGPKSGPDSGTARDTQNPACGRQRLSSDLESSSLLEMSPDDLAGPGSGCAVALDLAAAKQ
jgi:hypothetical protein